MFVHVPKEYKNIITSNPNRKKWHTKNMITINTKMIVDFSLRFVICILLASYRLKFDKSRELLDAFSST